SKTQCTLGGVRPSRRTIIDSGKFNCKVRFSCLVVICSLASGTSIALTGGRALRPEGARTGAVMSAEADYGTRRTIRNARGPVFTNGRLRAARSAKTVNRVRSLTAAQPTGMRGQIEARRRTRFSAASSLEAVSEYGAPRKGDECPHREKGPLGRYTVPT